MLFLLIFVNRCSPFAFLQILSFLIIVKILGYF